MRWIGAGLVALLWVSVMTVVQYAGASLWAIVGLLAVPGAITVAVRRGGWPQVRRWLVVLLLAFAVDQTLLSLYLIVALTWALHRSWVGDRRPVRLDAEEKNRG